MEAPVLSESWRRVAGGARALSWREAVRGLVDSFRRHDLVLQASALSFRAFLALVPCLLFVFGLVGFLGLEEIWRRDIVPELRSGVSSAAFTLIDDAVTHVLTQQQLFWVTAGALLATWQVSAIVRGVGHVLNRIYEAGEDDRSLRERLVGSFAVAAVVGVLVLGAVAIVRLAPLALDDLLWDGITAEVLSFVVRWLVAAAMLLVAIGLMVRAGPEAERPLQWVTFGALIVVTGWALMSLLFGLYLTQIADYGSIFGNLATVFILLEYLYLSSMVLIGGLVLDRLVQESA